MSPLDSIDIHLNFDVRSSFGCHVKLVRSSRFQFTMTGSSLPSLAGENTQIDCEKDFNGRIVMDGRVYDGSALCPEMLWLVV